MRRRQLMEAGASLLAVGVTARGRHAVASQDGVEQIVEDTYDEPGLTTGVSTLGDIVVYGFDDGNVMVYDDERDGQLIPLIVDRSISHLLVREPETVIVAWMDADVFGPLDLETGDGPLIEHPGLWDIDATSDGTAMASVTYPHDTVGSVGVADDEGTVLWSSVLEDAVGYAVAIAEEYVAVATAHYWEEGTEPTGQPGVRLFDDSGAELWRYDYDEDVLSVDISLEHEIVVAGTDDGRTIVLDLEGNPIWETDDYGGWVELSGDGETIVTSGADGTLSALESMTGEVRWETDIGMWAAADLSVSDDGTRVFVANRPDSEFAVIDDGETIWTESHEVGPGLGELATDGSAWSTIVTDLEAERSLLAAYRDPEATTEATNGDAATEDPETETPVSLELVDYSLLGDDPQEEYITLRNTGEQPLDLTGWRIEDEHGIPASNISPFDFPSGFTLEPDADVTIVTGQGTNTADTLYWGYQRQVWNEEGDTVFVFDSAGTLQLEASIAAATENGSEAENGNENDEANNGSPDGELTVVIDQTNAPVEAGEQLLVVANLANNATTEQTDTLELVVGGEVVDSQSVTVAGEATQLFELGYTTYPVEQDVSFEVTVRTSDDSAATTVSVFATDDNGDDELEPEDEDSDSNDEPDEPGDQDEGDTEDPSDSNGQDDSDDTEEPTDPNESDEQEDTEEPSDSADDSNDPDEESDPGPEGGEESSADAGNGNETESDE
ncbi:lamin tail domain-containing protein [Natrialbaceae archaeon A-CW2]